MISQRGTGRNTVLTGKLLNFIMLLWCYYIYKYHPYILIINILLLTTIIIILQLFKGSSTRNERIEKFWFYVNRKATFMYKNYFKYLEDQRVINFDNPLHRFIIHYLFLPRLNLEYANLIATWNNHKLSTERNRTPNEITYHDRHLSYAVAPLLQDNLQAALIDHNEVDDEFDLNNPPIRQVIIDPTRCPLSEENYALFKQRISPITMEQPFDSMYPLIVEAFEVMNELI